MKQTQIKFHTMFGETDVTILLESDNDSMFDHEYFLTSFSAAFSALGLLSKDISQLGFLFAKDFVDHIHLEKEKLFPAIKFDDLIKEE